MGKKNKVDDLITAIPGEWSFDDQVSRHFDSHVRKSLPMYDDIQKMVVDMSEWFVRDNTVIYDIGCSTGETIALLQKKHKRKTGVTFVGIDNSRAMIDAAARKVKPDNARLILKSVEQCDTFPDADFMIALFTMQFLPLNKRKSVLQVMYDSLSEGGALVLAEKIRADYSLFENIWQELNWDYKKGQGLSDAMILQKARSLRGILTPLSLTENIDLLRQVGFPFVDTFFKRYNFAGLIAFKTCTRNPDEAKNPKKKKKEK